MSSYPAPFFKGLVLVNPATSYLRSALRAQAPKVSGLPEGPAYLLGLASLLPLFSDEYQLPQLFQITAGGRLPSVIDTPAREAYMGRVALSLPGRLPTMPRDTLKWRLEEWLEKGAEQLTDARLAKLQARTLVVAGSADKTLPSTEESSRLCAVLPRCERFLVEGAGHSATCGSRCDLAALLRARFPELQAPGLRTTMKPEAMMPEAIPEAAAAAGASGAFGVNFGLVERGHPTVSPLDYWDERYLAPPERGRGIARF